MPLLLNNELEDGWMACTVNKDLEEEVRDPGPKKLGCRNGDDMTGKLGALALSVILLEECCGCGIKED